MTKSKTPTLQVPRSRSRSQAGLAKGSLTVGLGQFAVADGAPEENLERVMASLESAPAADIYLLPELWTTGYAHHTWQRAADEHTAVVCRALQDWAAARQAAIGGSLITRGARGLVNRFWLFLPGGAAPVWYDKGHLFEPLREDSYLVAGEEAVNAKIAGWDAGLSICFDLRFPEMYRRQALGGVELFLVVSAWPAARRDAMSVLARARAIENQCYVALCNRAGLGSDGTEFGGGSMLIGPSGEVVSSPRADPWLIGSAVRDRISRAREAIPALRARSAELDGG